VLLGAAFAFLILTAIDRLLDRHKRSQEAAANGRRLALMIAIGIGLHNLGEGLAIGSADAVGALAVGAALVVGFALHNTTEGLAIVAPLTGQRPPATSLIGVGASRSRRPSARPHRHSRAGHRHGRHVPHRPARHRLSKPGRGHHAYQAGSRSLF
jgi:hypothetical protein